jgi:hypothetical protein
MRKNIVIITGMAVTAVLAGGFYFTATNMTNSDVSLPITTSSPSPTVTSTPEPTMTTEPTTPTPTPTVTTPAEETPTVPTQEELDQQNIAEQQSVEQTAEDFGYVEDTDNIVDDSTVDSDNSFEDISNMQPVDPAEYEYYDVIEDDEQVPAP